MTSELKTQANAYNHGYTRGYRVGLETALRVIRQIIADAAASEKPVLVAPPQPDEVNVDQTVLEAALATAAEDIDPRR